MAAIIKPALNVIVCKTLGDLRFVVRDYPDNTPIIVEGLPGADVLLGITADTSIRGDTPYTSVEIMSHDDDDDIFEGVILSND